MPLPKVDTSRLPFPVRTANAKKFWASKHVCNRAKAIIAFSKNRDQAIRLMRRYLPMNKSYHFRERAWNAWKNYVNMPDMEQVPFTPMGVEWWDCLPKEPVDPPSGAWAIWIDDNNWEDAAGEKWVEWLSDITVP